MTLDERSTAFCGPQFFWQPGKCGVWVYTTSFHQTPFFEASRCNIQKHSCAIIGLIIMECVSAGLYLQHGSTVFLICPFIQEGERKSVLCLQMRRGCRVSRWIPRHVSLIVSAGWGLFFKSEEKRERGEKVGQITAADAQIISLHLRRNVFKIPDRKKKIKNQSATIKCQ